jgi:hypothetical protein
MANMINSLFKIVGLLFLFVFVSNECNSQKDPNYSNKTEQRSNLQRKAEMSGTLAIQNSKIGANKSDKNVHNKLVEKQNSDFYPNLNAERPRVAGEIVSDRSEKHYFVDHGDGTRTETASNRPLHFLVDNKWFPIDYTILENLNSPYPNHTLVNQTNGFQSYFSESLSNGFITRFDDDLELVDMLEAKMYVINIDDEIIVNSEFNQSINTTAQPIIVGNNGLRYENIYSGIDLDIKLLNHKRKLDYVIKDNSFLDELPSDATYLIFEEKMSFPENLKPVMADNGAINLVDKDDELIAVIPFPTMHDSSFEKLNDDDFPHIYYKLIEDNDFYKLQLYFNLDWLRNANRIFPVYVDPSTTGSLSASYIDQESATYRSWSNGSCTNYADYEDVSTSASGEITSVSWSNSSDMYYYGSYCWSYTSFNNNYCGSYHKYRITHQGSGDYSESCGTCSTSQCDVTLTSTFDGESASATWRILLDDVDYDQYTGHNGTHTVSVTYTIPPPTITSFTPSSVCASSSESVTITGTNLSSATSVTIGGTAATITSNSSTEIVVTVGSGTTGTVSVTTSGGTATSSSSVTVNSLPDAVTVTGGGAICENATLSASGGSGGTIYWQGNISGGTQDVINSGSISPAITSTGTYYARSVSGSGCWGPEGSTEVTAVNPLPTNLSATADGASSADLCSGGSSQLSGSADDETVATTESGSQTFNWSGSSKYDGGNSGYLGDYVEGTISGLPADATITSITYSTDINYCSNGSAYCATWWAAQLNVNGTYQAEACDVTNASYSGLNGSIANGNVLRLWLYDLDGWNDCTNITFDVTVNYDYSGTTNAAATYSWSPSTGLNSTNIANPVASPNSSQTYTMTAAYSTGCTATTTTSVNVDPQPSISSHPSDGADVCIGETPTAMSVTATGGSGSYTYQWYSNTSNSNSGGTIIPVATSSSYTPGAGAAGLTYYYCVVSDAQSGCNDATSNAAQQRVNAATAGSITSSVDGGSTYSSDQQVIQVQNNMFWSYSSDGTNGTFSEFEYHWGDNNWSNSWNNTSNPGSWGAGQTFGADGVIYVRAKVLCGTDPAYTSAIATDWVWNYGGNGNAPTSAITASLSGSPSSISNGGEMRIDQTITYVKPSTSFESTNYAFQYEWNNDGNWSGDWVTGQNAVWSDNIGSNVSSGDAVLTVRTRHYGSGNDSYSAEYAVTLKKPVISTSGSLSAFSNCDGSASSAQSFNISGSYLGSDVTVTAPTGFELSESSGGTYTSSLTLSPTNGTLASTAIYVRVASSASGTPSGNVACTATAATIVNIAASATVVSAPVITSSSTVTDATTCGLTSIDISVDTDGATGTWADGSNGLFVIGETETTNTYATNTYNSDITLTWTNSSSATCPNATATITAKFNQPSPTGSMDTDSWVWGGLTNSTWSTGSNWYRWDGSKWLVQQVAYPDAGSKIYVLPTSDVCVSSTLNNAATSIGDLNIQGGTFDLGSTNTSITGNITNDGTMQGGTGTVTLSGSSDQTISGSGTINFNNLTVNKSSGSAIISTQTDIRNTLTMTKGNIVNSQPVVIGVNSSSPGTLSHASGIVTGELRKYFANQTGSTFFPIGTSSNMRDVTVNFTSAPGSNQYLTASYVAGTPTLQDGSDYNGLPLTTEDGQLIQNYSEDGYWVINPTGDDYNSTINSASYTIDLHCKNLTVQPSDVSKVRIIKSAGSNTAGSHHASWTGLTNQSTSGSASDFTVTGTSTGFSFFGAGSDDGNALPVELVSFSGACNDGVVELIWETASEYNSSHFDVENSRDGITWDVVKTIEAAGNSNELLTYGFNDVNAHGGDNYYRLTQVDIDGTSKTYDVINVSCSQITSGYFSIFPNPSSGSFQVMLNNSDIVGQAEMNIVDTKGNKVFMKSIDVKSGINMFVINESLAPGIYYVSVKNGDKTTTVLKLSIK